MTQLGFLLDRSGSIGAGNWTTITTGLAQAISTYVPVNGSYEVSVVAFASNSSVIVDRVLVDSVATRAAVAALIGGAGYTGGSTNLASGFDTLRTTLGGSARTVLRSYVNLATDGVPNDRDAGVAARDRLIAAGVDNISVEAIGSGVDVAYLRDRICYPVACDLSPPYAFPARGFYLGVADAAEYAAVIGGKVQVVTTPIPEPASLALLATGVAILASVRRRRPALA